MAVLFSMSKSKGCVWYNINMYYIYKLYFPDRPTHIYIGQTNDVTRRFRHHKAPSKRKDNNYKDNWIAKHLRLGEKLEIKIIDTTLNKDELDLKEIAWIKYYRSNENFKVYNTADGGTQGILSTNVYTVTNDLETLNITSITEFALEYNLDASALYKVLNGRYTHHKGWYFTKVNNDVIHKKDSRITKRVKLIKDNQIYDVSNLYKFCKDNNLDYGAMKHLVNGKKSYHSYKGYSLYVEEQRTIL